MESHRRWILLGSTRDIASWEWEHPGLPTTQLPLHQPQLAQGLVINPWDEVVHLPSYFDALPGTRHDFEALIAQARAKGKQLQADEQTWADEDDAERIKFVEAEEDNGWAEDLYDDDLIG